MDDEESASRVEDQSKATSPSTIYAGGKKPSQSSLLLALRRAVWTSLVVDCDHFSPLEKRDSWIQSLDLRYLFTRQSIPLAKRRARLSSRTKPRSLPWRAEGAASFGGVGAPPRGSQEDGMDRHEWSLKVSLS